MDKIKNKYEILLGFATLVLSGSALKDELLHVLVNIGFAQFTLFHFFLWMVCGAAISIYFYITEILARDTKIGHWKWFNAQLYIAYFLFVAVLLSPLLVFVIWLIMQMIKPIASFTMEADTALLTSIISSILICIITVASVYLAKSIFRNRRATEEQLLIDQIVTGQDKINTLLNNGQFEMAFMFSYNMLITYFSLKIFEETDRIGLTSDSQLIILALRKGLITEDQAEIIRSILHKRNSLAHGQFNDNITREEAERVVNFINKLMKGDRKIPAS